MDQDYLPIDCDEHDVLLALATLRRPMRCTVRRPDGQVAELEGIIEDVYTSAGAEYMRVSEGSVVRLDHILTVDGRPMGAGA